MKLFLAQMSRASMLWQVTLESVLVTAALVRQKRDLKNPKVHPHCL